MRRNVSLGLTRLGTAASLLGVLFLLPMAARAQDDVTLTMARERFKEGVGYFDKKDFAKARVAFLQAYALKKHPSVLLNLAQSELRSGHEPDAAKHFSQYLRDHRDVTESERQGAETGLAAARALVAELALVIDTSGAEVYVDRDLEGQAPLAGAVYLAPGSHEIQAQKDGKTANAQVTATAGQSMSLTLQLTVPVTTGAPATGSPPSAEGAQPPAGEAAETRQRKPFFPWLAGTPAALVGAGLTGAGAIGGGVFALLSQSRYRAADALASGIADQAVKDGKPDPKGACVEPEKWLKLVPKPPADIAGRAAEYKSNCDRYKDQDNVKRGDTFKTVAIVSLAVAGTAALGTAVYYIVDTNQSKSALGSTRRRVVVLPIYEPGFAGALVSGSF